MIQKFTALAISLTIFSCGYTQKLDSSRITKNQIGLIVSPAFNIYSNKKYFSDLRLGIIYRRELEKYNLRFSLNAIQNTNDQLLNNPNITIATEYIADTFLIKRIASSYSGEVDFRLGAEKTILNKKIDLIIGADLSIGLLTKNKFYNSSFEFYNTDTLTGSTTFTPCNHFEGGALVTGQPPDCEIPIEYQHYIRNGQATYRFLKLANQISFAARINISPKFRLTAQITPEIAYYILQSEREIDPKNIYETPANYSEISLGKLNLIIDFRF